MRLDVAVAKVAKYASRESGDTLEMIERPHGGLSFVLADGQGSGQAAKSLSNLVAKKAVALLADGVRDGAVARATHDFLYAYRQGKVSADLTIISVDLVTRTIVLSRNGHSPALVAAGGTPQLLEQASQAIGIHPRTKPVVSELPLAPGLTVVVFSDGIADAGERYGQRMDLLAAASDVLGGGRSAEAIAEAFLSRAVSLDRGRPSDDMSVVVLSAVEGEGEDGVRRLHVSFPIEE